MRAALLILAAFLFPLSVMAGECSQHAEHLAADCGESLKKNGWSEVARCFDGHNWSYILENGANQKLCGGVNGVAGPSEAPCLKICNGINARGGPSETSCAAFDGNIEKFKANAAKAQIQVEKHQREYAAASAKGKVNTKEYLDEQIRRNKSEKRVSCLGEVK